MKEENINTAAAGVGGIEALKEEVARLQADIAALAEKLKAAEADRDTYKDWWMKKEEENTQLITITKELVKLASLA